MGTGSPFPSHRGPLELDRCGPGRRQLGAAHEQVGEAALLILDDYGLKPLNEDQQSDRYELICERYEKASLIISSNRDFGEWVGVFSNPLMGSAAMDRLVPRGIKIVIQGKSYRLESFMKRVKNRAAAGMSPEEA